MPNPDLPLVDVAIAALTPEVGAQRRSRSATSAREPGSPELDLIANAQRARALGHIAYFLGRHADGDHGALGQIRLAPACCCAPNNAGPRFGPRS